MTDSERPNPSASSPDPARDQSPARPWTRREALGAGLGVVSLAVIGCAKLPPVRDVPSSGGEVRLALADYPDLQKAHGVVPVRPDGRGKPIMIVRGEGEQFTALSLRCTHAGCTVGWDGEARRFQCPCHGSRFAADGGVLKGPARRPLTGYPVRFDGQTLRFTVG
jgi:Rieske Fe-S protein